MGSNAKRKEAYMQEPVREEVKEILDVTEALAKGNFYKDISLQMQGELGRLAEYINIIRGSMINVGVQARYTSEKIPEATLELSGINDVTKEATDRVLLLTEKVLDGQERLSEKFDGIKAGAEADSDSGSFQEVEAILAENKEALISILAALSFQDMTGQRIRKIIGVVGEVQKRILEILLALGAKLEESEGDPDGRSIEMLDRLREMKEETDLKQDVVDDILKDLGL